MRLRHVLSGTALLLSSIGLASGGCGLVLGLGDYKDQADAQASSGSGASSSSSGTAGGSAGAGGAGSCGGKACAPPGEGEASCCFTDSAGGDVCALVVADWGETCVPLGLTGTPDMACPSALVAGRTLAGCCLKEGICGVSDPDHPDLGCVPGAAVGLADEACGDPGCGRICVAAGATECLRRKPLGVFSCAAACAATSSACEAELAAVAGCPTGAHECDDFGLPFFAGCEKEHVALAACREDENCVVYCGGIASACPSAPKLYASTDECRGFCSLMTRSPPGMGNSIVCRMQQLERVNAGTAICSAAGPSGAGTMIDPEQPVCGNSCPTYCWLMEQECPTQFQASYGSAAACGADCVAFTSTPPYDAVTSAGNTVQCRLRFAVQAAAAMAQADKNAACAAADQVSTTCQ